MPSILICDDDDLIHASLKPILKKYQLEFARTSQEALVHLKKKSFDVILLDVQMEGDDSGLSLVPKIRADYPDVSIVMLSGRTDYTAVRSAMKNGATDYLSKKMELEEIQDSVERVFQFRELQKTKDQQSQEIKKAHGQVAMVGQSPAIQNLRKAIEKLQKSDANVLITGEPGTGKEVVARQLRAVRADGTLSPFIAVDSSTIQASTAESNLFGHEKGAFTGADKMKKGLFEEADGGIIYFDEIGNMTLDIQAKLLRVLQEKEVVRMGASKPVPTNFRVVAATNANLEEMCKKGQFRDDLLSRISVIPLELSALRKRKEDLPLLIEHFIKLHNKKGQPITFTSEAKQTLLRYDWPGNVRELSNAIAYVMTMAEGPEIDVGDLPQKFWSEKVPDSPSHFYERMEAYEASLLKEEFANYKGNVSLMARNLKMDRSNLHLKLKKHKIS